MNGSPVWLITGCSSGFGRELAKAVLARGWRVVLTARDVNRVQDLLSGHEAHALALKLDVTDSGQIAAAVAAAQARFETIDVLVNNAGYGYLAAVEEGDRAQIRELFATNLFGSIEMIRAVLPVMRDQGRGHIVNISSRGGLIGSAGLGYYNATKFALEGLSEALADECRGLGIRVTIVEPGPLRTDFSGRSIKQAPVPIGAYAFTAGERHARLLENSGRQAGDPTRAAQAVIAATLTDIPPLRLLLGAAALISARNKLDAMHANFNEWQDITLSSDFPDRK
nr:oxidoreductase [Paraburkholderia xenovorans]